MRVSKILKHGTLLAAGAFLLAASTERTTHHTREYVLEYDSVERGCEPLEIVGEGRCTR